MTLKMELSFRLTLWDLERRKLNHVAESFFNFSLHYLHSVLALFLEMSVQMPVVAAGLSYCSLDAFRGHH